MGRKRKKEEDKKRTFHLSITKKILDELIEEAEKNEEVPSHIIEDLIKKHLNKK